MRRIWFAALLLAAAPTGAQEYLIRQPAEPASTPVHLTRPVEGRVEVTNLPEVQEVRVMGGVLDGPVPVEGEVRIRAADPLAVEVVNPPPELPQPLHVEGTITVDDRRPVRVVVTNPPPAPTPLPPRRFAAFSLKGSVGARQTRVRGVFSPPEGRVFRLNGVVLDVREGFPVRARVLADPEAIAGYVAGAPERGIPVALLDSRAGPTAAVPTPVPLAGPFVLEVSAPPGAPSTAFTAVVTGYLEPR